MGALWLPSDDELVVAQREPNLLVPRGKTTGKIKLSQLGLHIRQAYGLRIYYLQSKQTPELSSGTFPTTYNPEQAMDTRGGVWGPRLWASNSAGYKIEYPSIDSSRAGKSASESNGVFFACHINGQELYDSYALFELGSGGTCGFNFALSGPYNGSGNTVAKLSLTFYGVAAYQTAGSYFTGREGPCVLAANAREYDEIDFYKNGNLVESVACGNYIPLDTSVGAEIARVGQMTSNVYRGNHSLVIATHWPVPDEIAALLSFDPYLVVEPANDDPFALTLPTAYSTLSAVEAAAYSASSITPRCDIAYP